MQCPVDGAQLVMSDRNGVEIDYCPTCRGVWLDRGELDKIIERSVPAAAAPRGRDDYKYDSRDRDDGRGHGHGRRRNGASSFLGDIFDF